MVTKDTVLTNKGKEKIESELEHLKTVRRREIAERLSRPSNLETSLKIRNMMKRKMNRLRLKSGL
jgi:transcription elongation GreA/GreB family factor